MTRCYKSRRFGLLAVPRLITGMQERNPRVQGSKHSQRNTANFLRTFPFYDLIAFHLIVIALNNLYMSTQHNYITEHYSGV